MLTLGIEDMETEEKRYKNLEEAEPDMRRSMPPVLYKYRDWNDENHKKLLTEPSIWFSHPKTLNDPYDIRVPESLDYGDIGSKEFYEKIKEVIAYTHPEFKNGSRDYETACDNLYDAIKKDPKTWFERNQRAVRDSDLFDSIGIFSLSLNELSELLWAYYGNNGQGFCVGFDPVKIYKAHPCSFSKVQYKDEPIERKLLEGEKDFKTFWNFFVKQKKWNGEEEYRFVSMFMEQNKKRIIQLPTDAIKEVIFGLKINNNHKQQIMEVLRTKYKSKVPLYEIKENVSSFGFEKVLLNY